MQTVLEGTTVVVGGGVTGLVTAHLLAEAGCDVVVVEREPVLGGLARSYRYGRFVFDVGPHRFHTSNRWVSAWLSRVMESEAVSFPRHSEVYFKDSYYAWPLKPANLTQLPPGLALMASFDLAINGAKRREVDSFETHVLNQYGRTLYEHFFRDYSIKFLGIHPRDTHPDWATTGLNRAIIDEKLQMHNIMQLAKTTLFAPKSANTDFLYPRLGMYQAWDLLHAELQRLGVRILTDAPAELVSDGKTVVAVRAGGQEFPCAQVVWTAPITLAMEQLGLPRPQLDYLGLLLYNVVVEGEAARPFQWCYYGQKDLVFSRVSIPRYFSDATSPDGTHGLCVEVTAMDGDRRWQFAERITDRVVDELLSVGLIPHRGAIQDVHVERVRETYPIYHKRYPGQLKGAQATLAEYPNLHLAGRTGKFWYNNMDHSIEDALALARRLLRDAGRREVEEDQLASGALAS